MPGPKLKVKNKYRDRPGSSLDKSFPLETGDRNERAIRDMLRFTPGDAVDMLKKLMQKSGKFMTKS